MRWLPSSFKTALQLPVLQEEIAIDCVNSKLQERGGRALKDEQDLYMIVSLASGCGLGAMLALSEALRIKDAGLSLQFSVRTVIVFTVGFVAAHAYLNRILRSPKGTSRLFFRIGLTVLFVLVGIAFGYPLRLLAIRTVIGNLVGVLTALCFIVAGLVLIRCFVRSAELEESVQEAKERSGGVGTTTP